MLGRSEKYGFSTTRDYAFSDSDKMDGRIIEVSICDFRVDIAEIAHDFDVSEAELRGMVEGVNPLFDGHLENNVHGLSIAEAARPLPRMVARAFDLSKAGHSSAM